MSFCSAMMPPPIFTGQSADNALINRTRSWEEQFSFLFETKCCPPGAGKVHRTEFSQVREAWKCTPHLTHVIRAPSSEVTRGSHVCRRRGFARGDCHPRLGGAPRVEQTANLILPRDGNFGASRGPEYNFLLQSGTKKIYPIRTPVMKIKINMFLSG